MEGDALPSLPRVVSDDRASPSKVVGDDTENFRKHPAHPAPIERANVSVILFVTVCTAKRKSILANPTVVALLLDAWRSADHWLVGRYVILPEHIHLFCAPRWIDALSVQKWVAFWKSRASKRWPHPE